MTEVELPDGTIAEFPDDMTQDAIQSVLRKQFGAGLTNEVRQDTASVDAQKAERDKYYSSGIYAGSMNPLGGIARTIDAFASGAQRSPLMGWDDEAVAGLRSLGGGTTYEQAQSEESARKEALRAQNPVASIAGEIAGGLASAKAMPQLLAGRAIPHLGRAIPAAAEGAAWGAVAGAGEANPEDRLSGAGWGALIGSTIGGTASAAGDWLAGRAARKAAQELAPSVDDLAAQSNNLYSQARAANITVQPTSFDKVANNMQFAAGRINRDLRPKTAGIVDDVMALKNQPVDLQQLDELRQGIGMALRTAEDQDARTLMRMKTVMDSFADNATPADVTGNVDGFKYIKEARDLWRRKSKSEAIETMMDLADVDSAKYTQSGLSNAIKLKSKQLYNRIAKGQEKGFNAEEIGLIRQLSKGELTPKAVEWLAKFKPGGNVSTLTAAVLGGGAGSLVGGPLGAIVGLAPAAVGMGAAKMTDRAAMQGLNALRAAAASDAAPVLGAVTNKTTPLIRVGSSQTGSQIGRSK